MFAAELVTGVMHSAAKNGLGSRGSSDRDEVIGLPIPLFITQYRR